MQNLLDLSLLSPGETREAFEALAQWPGARIERIISPPAMPPAEVYDQDHDEFVVLLSGSATLWIEGQGEQSLQPGDALHLPAHQKHQLRQTDPDQPSIWLAIHQCMSGIPA